MNVVAIDIGGTTTRACIGRIGDVLGVAEHVRKWPSSRSYAETIQRIADWLDLERQVVDAIGISIGAGVNQATGEIFASGKFPDFIGKPLRRDLSRIAGCDVRIAHDCICALAALVDEGRVVEPSGYVTFSTGIGAAIVASQGSQRVFARLRIAHQVIDDSPYVCVCGRRGCAATFLDEDRVRDRMTKNFENIIDEGFWSQYIRVAGQILGNFASLCHLRSIAIGGGVLDGRHDIAGRILGAGSSIALGGAYGTCEILWSQDSELLPLRGAYLWATEASAVMIG